MLQTPQGLLATHEAREPPMHADESASESVMPSAQHHEQ